MEPDDKYTFDEIARYRDQLFAHSPSYFAPEVAAGRTRERSETIKALTTLPKGSVVIVSELLGSGKTFLLRLVRDEMIRQEAMSADEKTIVSVRELSDDDVTRTRTSTILVLDEIDKKIDRGKLLVKLDIANQLLGQQISHMVLSGDFMLQDDEVLGRLSNRSESRRVKLDGLTKSLFQEAMTNRASFYAGTKEKATAINEIFAADVVPFLLPNTNPQVATFREVLKLLSDLTSSEIWPLNREDCLITGELLTEWFGTMPVSTFSSAQTEFLEWLREAIADHGRRGAEMHPFSVQEVRTKVTIRGITTDADYESKVLDPLVSGNVLRGFGLPHKEGIASPRREPGPYLPTSMTFLRAAFDEWWLEPES